MPTFEDKKTPEDRVDIFQDGAVFRVRKPKWMSSEVFRKVEGPHPLLKSAVDGVEAATGREFQVVNPAPMDNEVKKALHKG